MFKLGSVYFLMFLKEVSSSQQGCIYCTRKNTSLIQERGSKKGQKCYFTNLFILKGKLCFVGIMSDRMYKNVQC